jgi:hypothetical protein
VTFRTPLCSRGTGVREETVKLMEHARRPLENVSERDRSAAKMKIRDQIAGVDEL